ncbi:MAG: hypothetical protein C9356_20170 [Oleiphilus sp.]|nr:MAG: hypothetical protein C9356_20170 [Oleiphilus sp.]
MNIESDQRLIDCLKHKFSKSVLIDLADYLNLPASTLSVVVRGQRPFNWYARMNILSTLGYEPAKKGMASMDMGNLVDKIKSVTDPQLDAYHSNGNYTLLKLIAGDLDVCSGEAVNFFNAYLNNKYKKLGQTTLDQEDRIHLIEILYRDNPLRWGELITKLSNCVSEQQTLEKAIERIIKKISAGSIVLTFLSEAKACKSDRELCSALHLTTSQLSRMRNGRIRLSERVAVEASFLASLKLSDGTREAEFSGLDRLANNSDFIIRELL